MNRQKIREIATRSTFLPKMTKRKRILSQNDDSDEENQPPGKRIVQNGDFELEEMETENHQRQYDEKNWEIEAGAVISISMKNFMCHANFVYEPNSRINFVTGVNGSGKSAVMSALMFGLGGAAKLTNRGTANKNLVQNGKAMAEVVIILSNLGENAYKSVSIYL